MINIRQQEIQPKFPILHGYEAKAKTAQELSETLEIQTVRSKNFGLAYAPPYGEERQRLEHRLREVHYERERCRGR